MTETLETLAQLFALIFVVGSMAAMGLSLTMSQIVTPLRNGRLVGLTLVANFILVPALAYLIILVFSLDQPIEIGLVLLATAAGAPFLPKLTQTAQGDIALSVGLMVMLMVVTVVYLPIVLPLMLGDVDVNPWDIASSLIVLMLIPLALALFVRARWQGVAASAQAIFSSASNFSLIALMVLALVLNFSNMIELVGSLGILAGIIFIVGALLIGLLFGGRSAETRSVVGLGTAQRNISAALVVGAQNFDSDVVTYLIVIAVIGLVVLMPTAGELGKRAEGATVAPPAS
jgi:BASS family bile acid:Na+ symporter